MSTRSLTAALAVFVFGSLMMIALLAVIVAFRPTFRLRGLQLVTPAPTVAQQAVKPGQPSSEIANAGDAGLEWSDGRANPTPSPLLAKPVVVGGEVRPQWTATPIPTNTPTPSPTPNPTFVSSAYGLGNYMPEGISRGERWIDVDVTQQKLVAYEGFLPVFETLVSTGTAGHPTVTGQFRIWLRFKSQDMDGYRLGYNYYLRNVPYVQYFYEDYALHGTFWHSNFGTPMSHGCVNLATPDAEWLYNWAGYGTLVNVHP